MKIGLALDRRIRRKRRRLNPPSPVVGLGLIDTGASSTCFDCDSAAKAGLAVVDSGPGTSATHANEVVPTFAGRMAIDGLPVNYRCHESLWSQPRAARPSGVDRRDILGRLVLIYNGSDGSVTLSIGTTGLSRASCRLLIKHSGDRRGANLFRGRRSKNLAIWLPPPEISLSPSRGGETVLGFGATARLYAELAGRKPAMAVVLNSATD